jgi:hypothetical protein
MDNNSHTCEQSNFSNENNNIPLVDYMKKSTLNEFIKNINQNNNKKVIEHDINYINNIDGYKQIERHSILYNSFYSNSTKFFYLIENFNYNIHTFIENLINNQEFYIFDKDFYNKLNKLEIDFSKIKFYNISEKDISVNLSAKTLLNFICKSKKIIYLKSFLQKIIDYTRVDLCKEFINKRPYFLKSQLDFDFLRFFCESLEYKNHISYPLDKKLKKEDFNIYHIFELLLPYFVKKFAYTIAEKLSLVSNSIIVKHNAVKFFQLFDKYDIYINFDHVDTQEFPILADSLKYGTCETLKYLISKYVSIPEVTYFTPEVDIIDCCFYNYNYKVTEIFLDYLTSKIQNENKCITYYTKKDRIYNYLNTIFQNYKKKLENMFYYHKNNNNNKNKNIIKSSLKKQISLLFNFINNDSLYKENNINMKKEIIDEFKHYGVVKIINNNINIAFFEKYDIRNININLIISEVNIFKNEKNKEFLISFFNDKIYFNNFVKDICNSLCQCKIEDYMEIIKTKNIIIKPCNQQFDVDINNVIINFLKNSHLCSKCKEKNNLDFIIDFMKKYYLKNSNFESDSLFYYYFNSYSVSNLEHHTKYTTNQLLKKYFLNGLSFRDLIYKSDKKKHYGDYHLDYYKIIEKLKKEDITKQQKTLLSYVLINYLIKTTIIRKRNKNISYFKNSISKINNEFKFSPNDEKTNINKFIGVEFKKGINKMFVKNPIHIKPQHCISYIFQTHIYITEKADGIRKTMHISNVSNLFDNIIVEYEIVNYEKDKNINVIYNINNQESIFENMNYLRNIHPFAPKHNNYEFTKKNINEFIKKEKDAFDKYIEYNSKESNYKDSKLWWPKFVWIINKTNNIEYLKSISNLKPLNIFKTDGYILYSENINDDIIKVKPFELLTIDLKYERNNWYTKEKTLFNKQVISTETLDEGGIYRLYYDKITKKYYSKEKRTDKKYPNNDNIVNYLVKCHKSQWTIQNIIDNLEKSSYYQYHNKNIYNGLYLKNIIKKYSFENTNSECFKYINGNVLDLGCGYKQNYLPNQSLNKFNKNFTFLDNDISIILDKLNKNNTNQNHSQNLNQNMNQNLNTIKYGLYDFTLNESQQHEHFGEIYNYCNSSIFDNYDTIIMLNTIHNGFPNYENIKNNLNNFSKVNTNIIIRYLDRDLLQTTFENKNNETNIDLNNFGFIKKYNDKSKVSVYFNWCHNKQNNEYLVNKTDLLNLFENYKIVYEEEKIINNDLPNIEKYLNCFKTIVFKLN